ncbi:unnamed protein product [Heterosigma akashiwo]
MSKHFYEALLVKKGPGPLSLRDKARIRSCAGPGAGNWLEARPVCQAMTLSNPAISTAFRWRFGLALVHDTSLRCACSERIDREGYHFQRCLIGGHHITRHHALRGATASLVRQVAVVQEERYASTSTRFTPETPAFAWTWLWITVIPAVPPLTSWRM